jgi:hypothetical protein
VSREGGDWLQWNGLIKHTQKEYIRNDIPVEEVLGFLLQFGNTSYYSLFVLMFGLSSSKMMRIIICLLTLWSWIRLF